MVLTIGKRDFSRENNEKIQQINVLTNAVYFFNNINHFLILENEKKQAEERVKE